MNPETVPVQGQCQGSADRLTVGIIVAMEQEFSAIAEELLPGAPKDIVDCSQVAMGVADGVNYVIFQCGIGTTNAAIGACDLIARHHPHCLLNLGTTALIYDPAARLQMGDVLVARQHQQWDLDIGGPITSTWTDKRSFVDVLQVTALYPSQWLWQLLLATGEPVNPTTQFTGNSFFCTAEQQQMLPVGAERVSVDMESFAVAQVAARKGIAFLSLRGVSDTGRDGAATDFYANVRVASRNSARVARALVRQLVQPKIDI